MVFDKILNWKLLSGSHPFPGPDGGTCINEAAIVAAGFEYCSVSSADDCPPCFSRVLSAYAIVLNDNLTDDRRQSLLMPFVTRLAGTADSDEIEWQRFDYIMLGFVRMVLPITLRGWQDDLAAECEAVTGYDQAISVVNKIGARDRDLALAYALARDLALVLDLALARDLLVLDLALALARDLALALALARDLALALVRDLARDPARDLALVLDLDIAAVALLEGAMKIGNQAEPIETAVVERRMEAIKSARVLAVV